MGDLFQLKAQEALGKTKPIASCTCGDEIFEDSKLCGKCGAQVKTSI